MGQKKSELADATLLRSSSLRSVAARHHFSPSFVYAEVRAGRLRAFRLHGNGPLRVLEPDERNWLFGGSEPQGPPMAESPPDERVTGSEDSE